MPLSKFISGLFGGDSSGLDTNEFECEDCGNTFESAKRPERVQCMECLSSEATIVDDD